MDQKLKDTPKISPEPTQEEVRRQKGPIPKRAIFIAAGLALAFALFFLNVIMQGGV